MKADLQKGGTATDAGEGKSWGAELRCRSRHFKATRGFIFFIKRSFLNDLDALIRLKRGRRLAERRRTVIKTRIEEKEMRFHKTALFSKAWNLVSADAGPNLDELGRARRSPHTNLISMVGLGEEPERSNGPAGKRMRPRCV